MSESVIANRRWRSDQMGTRLTHCSKCHLIGLKSVYSTLYSTHDCGCLFALNHRRFARVHTTNSTALLTEFADLLPSCSTVRAWASFWTFGPGHLQCRLHVRRGTMRSSFAEPKVDESLYSLLSFILNCELCLSACLRAHLVQTNPQLLVDAMGDDGDTGVRCCASLAPALALPPPPPPPPPPLPSSLSAPLTVTSTFRDPARSLCSHSHTPCHVPRFSFPSVTGTVRFEPRKQAFTWAGCGRKTSIGWYFVKEREQQALKECDAFLTARSSLHNCFYCNTDMTNTANTGYKCCKYWRVF